MPSLMSGSGWEALPDVREALPDVREWTRGPPGFAGVAGRPSQMSGSDREALPGVREWSGGRSGCSWSDQEILPNVRDALLDVWEFSGDPN